PEGTVTADGVLPVQLSDLLKRCKDMDERFARLMGRRQLIKGTGVAAVAVGLTAWYGGGGTAFAAAGSQGGGRTLDLFPGVIQNDSSRWAFEYVDQGADVGQILAIANEMKGED